MAIGAVVVPIEDLPVDDMIDILNSAECTFVIYSAVVEAKIDTVRGTVPRLKTRICIGDTKSAEALKLADIAAKGTALFAGGDNSYSDYEIDPEWSIAFLL